MAFLDALRARGQGFVAEVPVTCTGWIDKLRTTTRRRRGGPPSTRDWCREHKANITLKSLPKCRWDDG